ncbi:MAG TPA: N-acetylneuraminate synthase family protein [Candidatus Nitrosocosmicus sp.]|nr:N-acetylneuraminate synthase family protein [Candidatus Nitrosocosmicus sp.]
MGKTSFNLSSLKNDDYCLIIAEAGSNHDQDIKNAYELIEIAADAGADAVKFQLFTAESLYSNKINYEIYETTKRAELPLKWIPELVDVCKSNKIMFLSTPFDCNSIDVLNDVDIPMFKWASGEIDNLELLQYAAKSLKPILISTGMCNLSDIESAIVTVNRENNDQIALLHCISLYPTLFEDTNLRMMDTLSNTFGYPVGFSDHTPGVTVAIAAVARGAKILEKHFTLDKNLKSPDHPFSLHPKEFKEMVTQVRAVSKSLGSNQKYVLEKEKTVAAIARRSIVAKHSISKGTKLTIDMISYKRPATGIPPKLSSFVLGRILNRDIEKDDIIKLDDFV